MSAGTDYEFGWYTVNVIFIHNLVSVTVIRIQPVKQQKERIFVFSFKQIVPTALCNYGTFPCTRINPGVTRFSVPNGTAVNKNFSKINKIRVGEHYDLN